jgi:hypothetical protein
LNRQGRGTIPAKQSHSSISDPCAHLHEAVEASSIAPRTAPAISIQRNIYQTWANLATSPSIQSQIIEGVGSVSVDENVRMSQQFQPDRSVVRTAQIKSRTTLAQCHLWNYLLVPYWRIDTQHVSPEASQKTRRDRSGEHAGKIKDTYSL